jgi:hypothetical protein
MTFPETAPEHNGGGHESEDGGGVHDEGHEHPKPFYSEPFVERHVFARAIEVLELSQSSKDGGAANALGRLERRCRSIDAAARLARRLMSGDGSAREGFEQFFQSRAVGTDASESHRRRPPAYEAEAASYAHERRGAITGTVNLVPILDILMTAAVLEHYSTGDTARSLLALRQSLERDIQLAFRLERELIRTEEGVVGPEGVLITLDIIGPHGEPMIPNPSLQLNDCLDRIMEVLSGPVTIIDAVDLLKIDGNTYKIARLNPSPVCAGSDLSLYAEGEASFTAERPRDVQVFFARCGISGTIRSWAEDRIEVTVPLDAVSGQVYFAVDEREAGVQDAPDISETLTVCFGVPPGEASLMEQALRDPFRICPDGLLNPFLPNFIAVQHPPTIRRFEIVAAGGRNIGEAGWVEACEPLTVTWDAFSDDGSAAEVTL